MPFRGRFVVPYSVSRSSQKSRANTDIPVSRRMGSSKCSQVCHRAHPIRVQTSRLSSVTRPGLHWHVLGGLCWVVCHPFFPVPGYSPLPQFDRQPAVRQECPSKVLPRKCGNALNTDLRVLCCPITPQLSGTRTWNCIQGPAAAVTVTGTADQAADPGNGTPST